jgi:hypothetical protein
MRGGVRRNDFYFTQAELRTRGVRGTVFRAAITTVLVVPSAGAFDESVANSCAHVEELATDSSSVSQEAACHTLFESFSAPWFYAAPAL